MTELKIELGSFHEIPQDLKDVLLANSNLLERWNDLTSIARNEWICYVTISKKPETKILHLKRLEDDLLKGKRRPCCWPGCPHRNPNSKKWFN